MTPQVAYRQICYRLLALTVYSRICGQGIGSRFLEAITMVVSAQNVDDMSKQKATGGHGASHAVVHLHMSGRERYIADHRLDKPAARCIRSVPCSC